MEGPTPCRSGIMTWVEGLRTGVPTCYEDVNESGFCFGKRGRRATLARDDNDARSFASRPYRSSSAKRPARLRTWLIPSSDSSIRHSSSKSGALRTSST